MLFSFAPMKLDEDYYDPKIHGHLFERGVDAASCKVACSLDSKSNRLI